LSDTKKGKLTLQVEIGNKKVEAPAQKVPYTINKAQYKNLMG
jgi:hypothetical protein